MAFRNTMMFLLFTMLICYSFSSGASTVYEVGDDEGWIIGVEYDEWSSSKEFHVGDTLLFSYHSHSHNVIEVTQQDYLSCNPTSPIAAHHSGSDTITLNKPGHYYFICGVPGHCLAGQKLEIVVTTSLTAPAIHPPNPPSTSHVHKVGGQGGWIIGPDYNKWSSSEEFRVGDTLFFSYNSYHNVMEVTQQDFESCNSSNPIASYKSGSDYIDLDRAGHYYFLCGAPDHCQAGQKVEVVVTSDGSRLASPPSTHPSPSLSPSTSPSHSTATTISAPKLASLVVFLVALAFF